ncbi:sphingoid long-chain base transporter RSB1 [Striga asiatica]|uniref:Sphingoid long-chain base transporter RSB1 n=1 Tax=Striga asiatica TaxID=4170 RepID=A0A5A7Q7L3_STRAF|nr:sphingoid long-chain base transporter RSB1 [Striga asiatica]
MKKLRIKRKKKTLCFQYCPKLKLLKGKFRFIKHSLPTQAKALQNHHHFTQNLVGFQSNSGGREELVPSPVRGNNSMITRSKLVEQLRDYQIRSQHRCPALVVFSPKPVLSTWLELELDSRAPIFSFTAETKTDVAVAIFWALSFILLLSSSYVVLYLTHYWISLAFMCIGILVPIRLRVARQSLARKRDRRLLLPLSM